MARRITSAWRIAELARILILRIVSEVDLGEVFYLVIVLDFLLCRWGMSPASAAHEKTQPWLWERAGSCVPGTGVQGLLGHRPGELALRGTATLTQVKTIGFIQLSPEHNQSVCAITLNYASLYELTWFFSVVPVLDQGFFALCVGNSHFTFPNHCCIQIVPSTISQQLTMLCFPSAVLTDGSSGCGASRGPEGCTVLSQDAPS